MDTKKLRQKILDLAIRGKLVPQDPNDEPASVLLERIKAEKERLIKEGKIKRSKKAAKTSDTPHYENVPFEIPENWCWCKLGDVCALESGYAFSSDEYAPTGTPLVRISNLSDGKVDLSNCVYVPNIPDNRFLVNEGDLLIAMSGATTGKMGVYHQPQSAVLNQRVGNLKIMAKGIDKEYRNYYMFSQVEHILKLAYGGTQPNISASIISDLPLPLPPYFEQKRIVSQLKKWFALTDSLVVEKYHLANAVKSAKAKILDLAFHGKLVPQDSNDEPASERLKRINPATEIPADNGQYGKVPKGWVQLFLGNAISVKSGAKVKVRDCTHGPFPVYGGNGINGKYEDYNVDENTIIIGRVGFYCGRVHMTKSKAWVTDNALVVSSNSLYATPFLFYLLHYLQLGKTSNSTVQPVISGKGILSLSILLPPLAEQHRIMARIEELFAHLDRIEESLQA